MQSIFGIIRRWTYQELGKNPTTTSDIYEKGLTRVLDQLTPEKTKVFIKKEKKPWYDEEVANMKSALRRGEKSG